MIRTEVVDASAIVAVVFAESDGELIAERLNNSRLIAPAFMPYEVANAMWAKARRNPDRRTSLAAAFSDFLAIPIESCEVDLVAVTALGLDCGLTVYDASYVWLAKERNASLVTLDRRMQRAASSIGVL